MPRLSKVTGDKSQDVVTIPSSQRGTQRRFESENPRGTANSTQRESVTSRSLAGNLGSVEVPEIHAAILTPAIQQ